ncbi:MAG: tyrosine-type recombinase/integrase [Deltaproteobacteria bacterium]|nr:tyrosine-type recombinase/integrase [Deltaproteobacteria bacterium]
MGVKVKERFPGEWWIYIHHNGRRKAKKIGKDKRLALEVAQKIGAKLTLGDMKLLQEDEVNTFGHYADGWINLSVPATCKPSTERDYKIILDKHVLPVFKNIAVNEINRPMIKNFLLSKVNEGFATSTISHMKIVLSGVLSHAVDDEVIPANPAHRLGKLIKSKSPQLDVEPLTRKELSILLKTFKKRFPHYYPLVLTLARTGMRLGEALALQWGDVDFNGRFIAIQRNMVRGEIGTPKSGKSRRVDMSRQLTETLFNMKQSRKVERLENREDWIFTSSVGTPMDGDCFRSRVFSLALTKAKLRKIRIHDLRHSYASALIQAGESLAYVRNQLGHHSIKVTVDIYGHLAPEGNKEAVDRLDDATFRNPDATKKKRAQAINA